MKKKFWEFEPDILRSSKQVIEEMLQSGLTKGLISAHNEDRNRLADVDLADRLRRNAKCAGWLPQYDLCCGSFTPDCLGCQISSPQYASGCCLSFDNSSRHYRGTDRADLPAELGADFDASVEIVYHPEFLREGSAVKYYFDPPKIVVVDRRRTANECLALLNRNIKAPTFVVKLR